MCPQGQLYTGRRQLGLARRAGADSCPWVLLCCYPWAMVTRHPLQLNMPLPTLLLPCCFHTGERPLWLVPRAAGRKADCLWQQQTLQNTHSIHYTPPQPQPTQPPQQQHAPPAQTTSPQTKPARARGRAAAAAGAQAACTRACIGRVSSRCVRERSTLRAPTSNCSDVWLRSRFGAIRSKLLCRS